MADWRLIDNGRTLIDDLLPIPELMGLIPMNRQ
jgi:hypothetical protein